MSSIEGIERCSLRRVVAHFGEVFVHRSKLLRSAIRFGEGCQLLLPLYAFLCSADDVTVSMISSALGHQVIDSRSTKSMSYYLLLPSPQYFTSSSSSQPIGTPISLPPRLRRCDWKPPPCFFLGCMHTFHSVSHPLPQSRPNFCFLE